MRKHKRVNLLLMLMTLVVMLSSCGSIHPVEDTKTMTSVEVVEQTREVKAAATQTPEPVIEIREPVKKHSPMRIQTDVPVNVSVPVFYQSIDLEGVNHAVYAFTNSNGETEFRVYAEVDELEDENVMNTLEGFFRAEVYNKDGEYFIQTNKDDNPINISKERPCKYTPCSPPTKDNVRAYIRNMNDAKKKYEQAVAKAEKAGEPAPTTTPWDGLPIYTEDTEYIVIPNGVKGFRKDPSLFYYVDVYGDEVFRRYATPNGIVSGFCLTGEDGKITAGSLMIDPTKDFVKENFKGRTLVDKPEDNIYRIYVYIILNSGEQESVEMIYQK